MFFHLPFHDKVISSVRAVIIFDLLSIGLSISFSICLFQNHLKTYQKLNHLKINIPQFTVIEIKVVYPKNNPIAKFPVLQHYIVFQ